MEKVKIIETVEGLDRLYKKLKGKDIFMQFVYEDAYKHPILNDISVIYINDFKQDYLINLKNSDSNKVDLVSNEFDNFGKVYLFGAKELLHRYKITDYTDLNHYLHLVSGKYFGIEELYSFDAHRWYQVNYYGVENINNFIPLMKHLEYCRVAFKYCQYILEKFECKQYSNEIIENLNYIEQSGLHTKDGIEYTQYNSFTSTGRPSNRFGGVNYAALNKTDGSREKYISRFDDGMLVEYDFDAYHLRLIADKVGYSFPNGSVHEHMAKEYGVSYEESKKLSFKYLYGGIPKEISKQIDYFDRVREYIDTLWNTFTTQKEVTTDIYIRVFKRTTFDDMNPNKLFNYMIQSLETERNIRLINDIKQYLADKKSKLILYSYDAFLFDFCKQDGEKTLLDLKNLLEVDGYSTKTTIGKNYQEMSSYELQ